MLSGVRQIEQCFKLVIVIDFLLFSMLMHDLKERLLVKYGSLRIVFIVFCKLTDLLESVVEVNLHDLLLIVQLYFSKPHTQLRLLIFIQTFLPCKRLSTILEGGKQYSRECCV
jgi:hypothetical protein